MDQTGYGDEKGCKSTLVSCNVTILGRRTSVRLEPAMWNALHEIAGREKCKVHDICSLIHLRKNRKTSLTAAIRVFLMLYYRAAATEEGHGRAGHGNFRSMMARARMPNDAISFSETQGLGLTANVAERTDGRSGQKARVGTKSSSPSSFSPFVRRPVRRNDEVAAAQEA